MNNVFVYCEVEGTTVQEVSQELLTKGRKLANKLGVDLEAVVAGSGIKGKVEDQILPYGVDKLFVFDGEGLFPYTSAPHTDIVVKLFTEEQPQIASHGRYGDRARSWPKSVGGFNLWSYCRLYTT